MGDLKKKVTRADLQGFGRMAERHWREHRPRLVKHLEAKGTLYESLLETEDRAVEAWAQMRNKGVDHEVIREIVLHDWILLPDIEAETLWDYLEED